MNRSREFRASEGVRNAEDGVLARPTIAGAGRSSLFLWGGHDEWAHQPRAGEARIHDEPPPAHPRTDQPPAAGPTPRLPLTSRSPSPPTAPQHPPVIKQSFSTSPALLPDPRRKVVAASGSGDLSACSDRGATRCATDPGHGPPAAGHGPRPPANTPAACSTAESGSPGTMPGCSSKGDRRTSTPRDPPRGSGPDAPRGDQAPRSRPDDQRSRIRTP